MRDCECCTDHETSCLVLDIQPHIHRFFNFEEAGRAGRWVRPTSTVGADKKRNRNCIDLEKVSQVSVASKLRRI
jgi:hypothetical protein